MMEYQMGTNWTYWCITLDKLSLFKVINFKDSKTALLFKKIVQYF